jgi:hypothetical protein
MSRKVTAWVSTLGPVAAFGDRVAPDELAQPARTPAANTIERLGMIKEVASSI